MLPPNAGTNAPPSRPAPIPTPSDVEPGEPTRPPEQAGPGTPLPAPTCDEGAGPADPCAAPRVILFIGDGMGPAYLQAARRYRGQADKPLALETLPFVGSLETDNGDGAITDSAAAATAMATGRRTRNGTISVASVDGAALTTALEHQQARGRRTGLVTTGTHLTDATPAAFGAHTTSRWNTDVIAMDYLTGSHPGVLLGGSGGGLSAGAAEDAGYLVIDALDIPGLLDPDADTSDRPIFGLFSLNATPPLAELTRLALARLSKDDTGFFLLVEHETTDTAGHQNALQPALDAVLELDAAVSVARAWAADQPATLIVVGADHETGGLTLLGEDAGLAGEVPAHRFTTTGHTSTPVSFFADGPGATRVQQARHLTDLFGVLAGLAPP